MELMSGYKCGLVSVSFRKNSPEEILSAVKDAGLECIEWGSDVHAPCNDGGRLEKLVKLQEKYGIYCSSYGTYFRLGRDRLGDLDGYIRAAKILGTRKIRLFCGDRSYDKYTEEERSAFISQCKEAAKIAEKNNVVFCMECHNESFTETVRGASELMKAVDSPSFRMYWQANQFVSAEENMKYASLISGYCEHIHVFNWKKNERYPLADAASVWLDYLSNFGEDKTLLLEFMPDDKIETLKTEAQAVLEIARTAKLKERDVF